jgi:hypothetical protein
VVSVAAIAAALLPIGAGTAGPSFTRPVGLPALPAMYGVACPSAMTCVVVGGTDVATVVTTTDGTRTWTVTEVPGIAFLYGVACADATHCVAVGTTGGATPADAAAVTQDLHTWTAVGSLPAAPPLTSVSCVAAARCMAVGSVTGGTTGWIAAALFSFDGGNTWAPAATPTHQGLQTDLSAISCPTQQRCVVVGGGAWVSDNFGGSWRDVSPPDGCAGTTGFCPPTYSALTGVDFTDGSHGAVVGGVQCGGQGVTKCPSVFFSTSDGGTSWKSWPKPNNSLPFVDSVLCNGLRCLATSDAFDSATVLATSDGSAWTPVASAGGNLNAVACAPGGPCVVVGQVRSAGIVLVSASGLASIGGGGSTTVASAAGNDGGGAANSVVSSFSTSLPTPTAVGSSIPALLLSALLVLALVLLVVFPSQLFNRTYEENHERIRAWWEGRLPWTRSGRERAQTRAWHGAVGLACAVLVGAALGTLLDPKAGLNKRSAALFAGIVLSLLFSITLAAAVNATYRRVRKRGARWELRALPSGLVVAALCVLVSRVVNFHPGYLYGIIGGIAFAGALPRKEEGRLVALLSAATLAVAVIAWLLWVPAAAAAAQGNAGFGTALWANLLSALFVGGLAGVVIGLVPLRFLPGEKLAAWHWGAWSTVFALALFGMVQIMLRPQSASAHVASVPLWTTVGLFLAFGTASVAFWGYFRATTPRREI